MPIATRYWTLTELLDKIKDDLDLQEEVFVDDAELTAHINEAIDRAEQEVHALYEDYFLTDTAIHLVAGVEKYDLPDGIYAHKIRRLIFEKGSQIYRVRRMGDWKKFERKAIENVNNTSTLYEWFLVNDNVATPQVHIIPPSIDTSYSATFSASSNSMVFTDDGGQVTATVPVGSYGTYTDPAAVAAIIEAAMNAVSTNLFTVVYNFQQRKFLVTNTDGAVFSLDWSVTTNSIRGLMGFNGTDKTGLLAYTGDFAVAPGRITLWYLRNANRLVNGTDVLDVPEAANYVLQYVKVRVYEKEHNPMLQFAQQRLDREREMLVGILAAMVPDAENEIEPDFTMYEEMS
jgi:hypothetical protein